MSDILGLWMELEYWEDDRQKTRHYTIDHIRAGVVFSRMRIGNGSDILVEIPLQMDGDL